ncbi:MAG: 3-oxoacyl-[acyl-carrier-protein] reductase, partial [Alphaproteobacteria bacterium]
MFDLTNKTALITGATGGIGRAIAKTLHALGANLVLTDISIKALESLKAELGNRVVVFAGNITQINDLKSLVKFAQQHFENIDILVNNAGITKDTLSMRMTDEMWDAVLAVNLTAGFRLIREVLPQMMKKRWGRIISMASIVGVIGNVGQANYAASKAGLIAMTKSVAGEVGARGITANCIAPGFIATPMTENLPDNVKQMMLDRIPMKRMGTPQDIAHVVAFLASEESAYITGQTVNVNGGM